MDVRMRKLRIGTDVISFSLKSAIKNLIGLVLVLLTAGCQGSSPEYEPGIEFSGLRAYQDVLYQVSLGPRIPGQIGHRKTITWIRDELVENGWQVDFQNTDYLGQQIINVIGFREQGAEYVLIGAHYDTRIFADQDLKSSLQGQAVPGANDGASGVAVLMELARVLPQDLNIPVRLVFFDGEDNGGIEGREWIMGSRAFVRDSEILPRIAVIVDMIGDEDLNIYYEHNSDETILEQIWNQAHDLGYADVFYKDYRHSLLDDHTPFLEAGVPAVDLIDFDYPYWHTTADTVDKVSPDSLEMIGKTLQAWILSLQ
jgi:glutaminyl-peptide cyclotransferase